MKFNGINVRIGKNVLLGKNVRIGDNTVIYDNVEIGDDTIICNDCCIGEPLGGYYRNLGYENPPLRIGANSLIRSNVIIYAGTVMGDNFSAAHYSVIRERNAFGNNCSVGVYCNILPDCTFGNFVHFHSYDSIGEETRAEDFVYFFPNVAVTSDPTPLSETVKGSFFGKYTLVTANVIVLPGSYIGRQCVITANSQVSGKFEDNSLISGTPARRIMDARKAPIINEQTKRRQYPWQFNFDRGLPWQGIGYEEWINR